MKEILKAYSELKPYCINEVEADVLIELLDTTKLKSKEIYSQLESTNNIVVLRQLWNLLDNNQKQTNHFINNYFENRMLFRNNIRKDIHADKRISNLLKFIYISGGFAHINDIKAIFDFGKNKIKNYSDMFLLDGDYVVLRKGGYSYFTNLSKDIKRISDSNDNSLFSKYLISKYNQFLKQFYNLEGKELNKIILVEFFTEKFKNKALEQMTAHTGDKDFLEANGYIQFRDNLRQEIKSKNFTAIKHHNFINDYFGLFIEYISSQTNIIPELQILNKDFHKINVVDEARSRLKYYNNLKNGYLSKPAEKHIKEEFDYIENKIKTINIGISQKEEPFLFTTMYSGKADNGEVIKASISPFVLNKRSTYIDIKNLQIDILYSASVYQFGKIRERLEYAVQLIVTLLQNITANDLKINIYFDSVNNKEQLIKSIENFKPDPANYHYKSLLDNASLKVL